MELRLNGTREYRQAADYVAAALIFLQDNVMLREPLRREHLKPRLLGHWGSCPGITMAYAALNSLVKERDTDVLLVTGPGHCAPANHANLWLEGTHETYDPALSRTDSGLRELARRYCAPDGFPSHLSPALPGTLHERGELGYALATAFGAAFDAPDRLVACIVGDGEAETGPTAGEWHSSKFLDPVTGGAVLPILHLNGYKISSPTVSDEELTALFRGYGWAPRIVDMTQDPQSETMMDAVRDAHTAIVDIQARARAGDMPERPPRPMIVLRSLKGQGAPAKAGGNASKAPSTRTRCPWPTSTTIPNSSKPWRRGSVRTGRTNSLTGPAAPGPRFLPYAPGAIGVSECSPRATGAGCDGRWFFRRWSRTQSMSTRGRASPPRAPTGSSPSGWQRSRAGRRQAGAFGSCPLTNSPRTSSTASWAWADGPTPGPWTSTPRTSRATDVSWKCSPSTTARAGSRATSRPAATGCSRHMRRSPPSWTACSTSTPSG